MTASRRPYASLSTPCCVIGLIVFLFVHKNCTRRFVPRSVFTIYNILRESFLLHVGDTGLKGRHPPMYICPLFVFYHIVYESFITLGMSQTVVLVSR